jgi:toxin ParE1/3/4
MVLPADNPHLGSVPADTNLADLGYRYLIVDSYLIFYIIEVHLIYIQHVIQGASDYMHLL